jgi:hypothetical protein
MSRQVDDLGLEFVEAGAVLWYGRCFQYTLKDRIRHNTGRLSIDSRRRWFLPSASLCSAHSRSWTSSTLSDLALVASSQDTEERYDRLDPVCRMKLNDCVDEHHLVLYLTKAKRYTI